MSLYYEKKLISGVREVPKMTLAQYNALTNKPKLWIRTDAPEGDRGINADDIQYDSNTSVKEAIDGVVVKSIPANTYNTYALALAELETYFNALTFSEKLRAKIVRSDSIVFFSQAIADKIFAMPNVAYSSGSRVLAQTIDLNNHTYITATIASGGVSVNDVSSSAQALKLELIV